MVGKRSNKCVVVACVVCAIYWIAAWPTSCFRSQRHFVSSCHRGKTCRQAENAEKGSQPLPKLPIGRDDFATLRTRKPPYAYVDKTQLLVDLVDEEDQHFLARPRRFGKTLLLDTIRCIFMDNGPQKDAIFDDLDITKSDEGRKLLKQELPVVFLKLNGCVATEGKEMLMAEINDMLIKEAQRNGVYGIQPLEGRVGATLETVIDAIRLKCDNKRVVFLVDEYDAPITQVLENNGGDVDGRIPANIGVLRALFTKVKTIASRDFHYSLYAGVSRFASTSLFSANNQLQDMSFVPDMASIVGFTENEVDTYFREDVCVLAASNVTLEKLAQQYGGYRFTCPSEELLNPWALLNRFYQARSREPQVDAWAKQIPKWANKLLTQENIPALVSMLASWKPLMDFNKISIDSFGELSNRDRLALLQQVGLLTIKDVDTTGAEARVKLGVPNDGVRRFYWRPALFGESLDNPDNASFFEDFSDLVAQAAGNVSAVKALQADLSSVAGWVASAFNVVGEAPGAAIKLLQLIRELLTGS